MIGHEGYGVLHEGASQPGSLVEQFAAVWQRTLDSVELPDPDAYLRFADQDSQDELRELLAGIDRQYRQRLAEQQGARTGTNWTDATFIAPPELRAAAAARPEPSDVESKSEAVEDSMPT
ncbi:MAG: hypothetical protein KY476_16345, partial [Planctomycetes bacterium]|nr:hypothetical protein [Planctomycetota bacterium]